MDSQIAYLQDIARQVRFGLVDAVYKAKDGHPGPSLGVVDIITALYFSEMNIDPQHPDDMDRDRFILSKGHACPALYAALAKRGYFPEELLPTLRSFGSILQGHPCMETPGIEMVTGSLGNGIATGLGMDIARQRTGRSYYTYVVTGDGALNEGIIWEAAHAAVRNKAATSSYLWITTGTRAAGTVRT
jgi:transketolase